MIELVPICDTDIDDLRACVQRYWAGLMPHAPVVRDPARGDAEFGERFRIDDPASPLWWAVLDGTRIGFTKVDIGTDGDGRWANVRDFFIEQTWRRKGHGTAFMRALCARLKDDGVRVVDLGVRADNPGAQAFYRGVGFELALYQLRRYLDE